VATVRAGQPRDRGSVPCRNKKIISFYLRPDGLWGSCRPFVQWIAVSFEVKRPRRNADHSHLLPNVRKMNLYLQLSI
jgi:hypothetical protein